MASSGGVCIHGLNRAKTSLTGIDTIFDHFPAQPIKSVKFYFGQIVKIGPQARHHFGCIIY